MTERKIKTLTLVFPHNATVAQCDTVAAYAQRIVGCGVSEGGFKVTRMPFAAGDERIEFADDEMQYVYGHARKGAGQ